MFQNDLQPTKVVSGPATVYFLDWINTRVLTSESQQRADKLFDHLAKSASPLGRLKTTPQTPPYHAEGAMVVDHVTRILAGISALEHGASLVEIEEFIREKDYLLEFQALEETIKRESAFLVAYAVCHDVAKADTVVFEAAPGSLGEAEGFTSGSRRIATDPERVRYDKLRRAHEASGASQSFYAKYQIAVHFPDHGRLAAADEFASTREAILNELDIPLSKAKLMTELIRAHLEVTGAFDHGPNPEKYKAFAAIAERVGLNVPVFLDLLPAAMFLDVVVGCLLFEDGTYRAKTELILNLFKSEREAMPERHLAREEALRRGRKHALRDTLQAAEIDADTVFGLLKTPYGPVRGQVMVNIHELIRDPSGQADFGEHTAELRRRAQTARRLLHERGLSL